MGFRKFLKICKNNLIIFFLNIKYPKRYLLKLRYLQRPFPLLSLRRLIYKLFFFKNTNQLVTYKFNSLFQNGILTFVEPSIKETLDEVGKEFSSLDSTFEEITPGYYAKKLSQKYLDIILPKLLPMADYYFGQSKKAIIREPPTINFISKETVDLAIKKNKLSSTDFFHIDTPNQLTMHLFCKDVSEKTPHLYYCEGIHNKNTVDLFTIQGSKSRSFFNFYKDKYTYKLRKVIGRSGTVSIFDPNGFHMDMIPFDSLDPRVYIHINFTPGNI